jgi:hypothetical protein
MIELQLLAALDALDQARERILARRPSRLHPSPGAWAVVGGLAVGWLARGLTSGMSEMSAVRSIRDLVKVDRA